MKVTVLYDSEGKIIGMAHESAGASNQPGAKTTFVPRDGHLLREMEVPQQLRHLKPIELHDAVVVDTKRSPHELVTKP